MKKWLGSRWRDGASATDKNMEQKAQSSGSALQSMIALHGMGRPVWTPRDYSALAREGYQRNPVVYRCIRMIAEAAASVPLCASRGGACEANDPAAKLLTSPHPSTSAAQIMEAFYGFLQLSGNGYIQATLIDDVPAALNVLRPDRMRAVTGRAGQIMAWEYEAGGMKRAYAANAATGRCAVHHMALFHPTHDLYGFSPLEAAAQAADVHNEGGVWTKALLDNSARPSGALVYNAKNNSERLSEEQFARLKSELEGAHSGARHAGRPLLLEGGLDWRPMGLTPADMDFTEARREAAREIALAFGIPPMLLGIPGDNTYSNYKEANLALWRQTILPLVRKTAQSFENWLRPFFGDDLDIHPETQSIPALAEQRHQLWDRLQKADFLSLDEKRAFAGLQPLDMTPDHSGPSERS